MSKLSVNELTDEAGTGAPSFPNGVSVTGAALTDPEITGGIYLGGTGSANYLDDYEEGTFSPNVTWQSGTPSYSATGRYTKSGRLVTIHAEIDVTSTGGSGIVFITNIPFVTVSLIQAGCGVERAVTGESLVVWASDSTTEVGIRFYDYTDAGNNGNNLFVTVIYEAV